MPVYNGATTLKEAVDSVLSQTFRNFELIICNDASTDETRTILGRIADDRVRVIHNPANLGEGPARDRAIMMAKGAWLAFIDADDIWLPERLERLMRYAVESIEKMIFDDIMECHDTPSGLIPWHALRGKHAFGDNGTEVVDVSTEKLLSVERLLIKPLIPLDLVKRHQVRHSCRKFGADIEFFIEILSHGLPLRYVPKPMYYYRITPGSMSALANRAHMMREVLENAIEKFEHVPAVQVALNKKIARVSRSEIYMPFVLALKKMNFGRALQLACRFPWIIPEFFRRFSNSMTYHMHRIWHGGRTRGIR